MILPNKMPPEPPSAPGEMKAGGAGWVIDAGFVESPFGCCCIGNGPRGVCFLEFIGKDERSALTAAWPQAQIHWNDAVAGEIPSSMSQTGSQMQLKALVRGTPFQLRVWRALVRISPECVVSYGQLAEAVGNPGAARAVGTVVGANPLAYLIPCHRVIRETGVIGQYRWGHERKRAMLGWEGLK